MDAGYRGFDRRTPFIDSKRVARALFGAFYLEDLFEKGCQLVPSVMRAFSWRIDPAMLQKNLIFIHVPRVAGTSVVYALYGPRRIKHFSIRYYRAVNPRFADAADSFALLRDPFDRFRSGYFYMLNGGTPTSRLSDVFVRETARIETVDDYLSFLEERGPFDVDFVMRPQTWFVCDLETGKPVVKNLFVLGRDDERLAAYLRSHGVTKLPKLNAVPQHTLEFTPAQRRRIERLRADDFALVESVSRH